MAILRAQIEVPRHLLPSEDLLHGQVNATYTLVHGAGVRGTDRTEVSQGLASRFSVIDAERARLTLEQNEIMNPHAAPKTLVLRAITRASYSLRGFRVPGDEFDKRDFIFGPDATEEVAYGFGPHGILSPANATSSKIAQTPLILHTLLWLPNDHETVQNAQLLI